MPVGSAVEYVSDWGEAGESSQETVAAIGAKVTRGRIQWRL